MQTVGQHVPQALADPRFHLLDDPAPIFGNRAELAQQNGLSDSAQAI